MAYQNIYDFDNFQYYQLFEASYNRYNLQTKSWLEGRRRNYSLSSTESEDSAISLCSQSGYVSESEKTLVEGIEKILHFEPQPLPFTLDSVLDGCVDFSTNGAVCDDVNSPSQSLEKYIAQLEKEKRERKLMKKLAGKTQACAFCKKNGECEKWYTGHKLKDNTGKVVCPVLRKYTCPICKAKGDNAHTIKYCPYGSGDSTIAALKTGRNAVGRKVP